MLIRDARKRLTADLLEAARVWTEVHRLSLRTLGERSVNDPSFFKMLLDDRRRLTLEQYDRIAAYIDLTCPGKRIFSS
jgi:hypothetical protein